ncbi:MAG: hypothetical protein TECD_00862 [Hyphomicrobiaceae bacterium hypho_1]
MHDPPGKKIRVGRDKSAQLGTVDRTMISPTSRIELKREQARSSIVQADSVTGKSLTLVIAIMCFLACLTAGSVYLVNKSASTWLRNVSTEISIQIEPSEQVETTDHMTKAVEEFIKQQKGIMYVRTLRKSESNSLLEPWLGINSELLNLPMPRLISVQLHPSTPPDLLELSNKLKIRFPNKVTLDDHRQWQSQIRALTRSFALGGIAIFFLVGAATTAIIVSATCSAMASNHEIVEVLNFIGATDGFIAREFEKHFLRLGIRAGIVGAILAAAVFFVMPTVIEFLGSGTFVKTELKHLIGNGVMDSYGYLILLFVVVAIAALCMITSRVGVFRILHNK